MNLARYQERLIELLVEGDLRPLADEDPVVAVYVGELQPRLIGRAVKLARRWTVEGWVRESDDNALE